MTTVLTNLPAGHTFEPLTFTLEPARISDYLAATADSIDLYLEQNVAPPLAIAAFALGALLEIVSLPEGTLHISESLMCNAAVPIGATVECQGRLAQRSVRAGMVVSVLETVISHEGTPSITARATVMSPGDKA